MAQPIPTESESEFTGKGVKVVTSSGKVTHLNSANLRSVTQDVAVAIAGAFGGDTLVKLFEDLTKATCVTNGGKVIPDNRTRLSAAIYVANQILGTPVQRSENVTVNLEADSAIGLVERLKNSPAMRESLRRALEAADEGAPIPPPLEAETVSK
jgi:hypothetical protein